MIEYDTSMEHRAHVEGAYEILRDLRARMVPLWLMGRDSFDLDTLRDALVQIEVNLAQHVGAAQKLEDLETKEERQLG